MKVKFSNYGHKEFFQSMQKKSLIWDCYHRAFFYTIGISEEARKHISELFDFSTDQINHEGLFASWQTSGSKAACKLAFNLWNGFIEDDSPKDYTPYSIFCCSYAKWFLYGIRLRYSEYTEEESYIAIDKTKDIELDIADTIF